MSPVAGVLVTDAAFTVGAVVVPATLWAAAFEIACVPKVNAALAPLPLRIVPPFSASARSPMLMPSASASASVTA